MALISRAICQLVHWAARKASATIATYRRNNANTPHAARRTGICG
jgi:hypothetical protein